MKPGVAGRTSSQWAARHEWVPLVTIGAAFIAVLCWTWGTWPDLLVDSGREFYAAWRLSVGDVLYRDLAWLNGPLSPYMNALWFRLFGVGLQSLFAANITLAAILVWLLFRVITEVGSRFSATIACLTFVVLFGFGQLDDLGNYNFISPYAHEVTHGVILSFASIAAFSIFLRSGSLPAIAGAGLALGLVFLTKAEVFFAAALAIALGFGAAQWAGTVPPHARRGANRWFLAGCALPLVVAWVYFWTAHSKEAALADVAGAWRYVSRSGLHSLVFYRRLAGLLDPAESLRAILLAAAGYAIVCGVVAGAAFLARRHARDAVASGSLAFAVSITAFGAASPLVRWDQLSRPLPLFMLVLAVGTGAMVGRSRGPAHRTDARRILQLTVIAFALGLLGRVVLNAVFYRYGFALVMPATLIVVVAIVDWIPAWLAARGWNGQVFRGFGLAAWCALMTTHLAITSSHLSLKRDQISHGVDAFRADARAGVVKEALAEIGLHSKPSQSLVVLPEGVMLNYLERRLNPTPYINFMPPELAAFGEGRMLESLNAHPPDYIALVHKDTSEYGFRFFGRDYGQDLLGWVDEHYRSIHQFGGVPFMDDRFGIVLMERNRSR